MKRPSYPWAFRPRFRARGFSWRGSSLAAQRLKEAVSEVKAVSRQDPLVAADGAIILMEKLWPALEQIDSSSGALGSAVGKTVHALLDLLVAAPADADLREEWLTRLWTAVQEDGVDFLTEVTERWGELCGTPVRASQAADELRVLVQRSWSEPHGTYFRGTPACLSCLLAAGRHQELLDLIDTAPFLWWHDRRYGVRALTAMGQTDAAIRYAEASRGSNDSPVVIARACEAILLAAGRSDEAYRRYALAANPAGTHLATFRALKKKYPQRDPRRILDDLIGGTPGEEGKWFAAAKSGGFLDLAAELAGRSPVDIATLIRAARDHLASDPAFALAAATAALQWMARGHFYELSSGEVWQATEFALQAAGALGRLEETQGFVRSLIDSRDTYAFVSEQLKRRFQADGHPR